MTTAITVENLGKRYRIGHAVERPATAGEAIKNTMAAPFRYLKYRLTPPSEEDTLWACRHISFEIQQGEVLGIIGANGAGKSTLLKVLSRITDPSEGRAVIRGRVNALLEVGVGFHPELTGRENIYLNAALHGLTTREINLKLDEIVEFSGVSKFLDTPVKRYSSGMKVRLGFGVAANLDPEILIVDEVLAVGDAAFQKKCIGKMEDVTKAGRTVLFVSHNMIAVQSMCNRVIWLKNGEMHRDGTGDEVVLEYLRDGREAGLDLNWAVDQAPGTEEVRIRRLRCCAPDGAPLTEIDMATEFRLEVTYDQFIDRHHHLNFHIVNENGIVVFSAGSAGVLSRNELGDRRGTYRCACIIPAHLLNSGSYFVKILIIQQKPVWQRDSLLMFDVLPLKKQVGAWHRRATGVIRPVLDWEADWEPLADTF